MGEAPDGLYVLASDAVQMVEALRVIHDNAEKAWDFRKREPSLNIAHHLGVILGTAERTLSGVGEPIPSAPAPVAAAGGNPP